MYKLLCPISVINGLRARGAGPGRQSQPPGRAQGKLGEGKFGTPRKVSRKKIKLFVFFKMFPFV